jgi:hypothetical protein
MQKISTKLRTFPSEKYAAAFGVMNYRTTFFSAEKSEVTLTSYAKDKVALVSLFLLSVNS